MNVNRLAVDDRSAGGSAASERPSASRHRHLSIYRYMLNEITVDAINQRIACIAQPCGILRDHIQHRLQVSRRVCDHAEDLARGGLLTIARLKLFGDTL